MRTLSILFALILFLGFNADYGQSESKTEKKESNETEMKEDNVASKPWNTVCPIRGGEIDPEVEVVEYNGKAYGFCCKGCDKKFEKEPEKYSKNLSEDGTEFILKK